MALKIYGTKFRKNFRINLASCPSNQELTQRTLVLIMLDDYVAMDTIIALIIKFINSKNK